MSSLLLLLAGCEPFTMEGFFPEPDAPPPAFEGFESTRPPSCDQDGDGAVRDDPACTALSGVLDCDDLDSAVHPGAPELCDGQDSDCDGAIDGPDPIDGTTWYWDADSDGWGATGTAFRSCRDDVIGAAFIDGDCDDADSQTHPSAPEVCGDGADQDCDGRDADLLDEGLACAWVTLDGPPGTFAGAAVAGTGDLTCDGAPDLAMSAPDQGETGQTRIYPGPFTPGAAPSVLATLHDPELGGLSGHVVPLGDLDGDGCDDVALSQPDLGTTGDVAAWLVLGDAQLDDRLISHHTLTAPGLTGTVLAAGPPGGVAELLVLAPEQDLAWLVSGPTATTTALEDSATTLTADTGIGHLGQVAALGDLDGDGVSELVLGDPAADDGAGRVLVVHQHTGWLMVTADDVVLSGRTGAALGTAVVVAGDLDDDGLQDLVIGSPDEAVAGDDRAGAVRVLRGGALADGPSGTLFGAAGERLGHAVVAPGNLTPETDDRPDLIVSSGSDGTLYWFARTDAGGMALPEQIGPSGLGGAGVSVASGGDLDRDGRADVLVGMPSEDQVRVLMAVQFGP